MSTCIQRYTNIIKIEFFEDSTSKIEFKKPFVVYDPLITVHTKTDEDDTISADCIIKAAASFVATIDDMSGSLTVNASTDVAGTKYKNVIEYDLSWIGDETNRTEFKSQLVNLQQHNYNIRVTYLGGAQQIIRSYESGWLFDYKESKGKPHITITIENISGAQRVE